ncbi:MAG: hypothetical protein PWQ75_1037 [Methanolobus sp.]|jgi:glycosyltransferase involved in cell wall biosynthesis|uniref:glycosyltransferase n=1 Tax=Methanolobus sp. TaxID=1874737 RepID=UPI00258BBEDE|nr:glycosyltransferase [Methanolobus sp.]MDK2831285.1 hypothetical protein [Methanolobus sp.]
MYEKYSHSINNYLNTFLYKKVVFDYKPYLNSDDYSPIKHALVSYLTKPLILPLDKKCFSNNGIATSIPKALNELGYSVDVVDIHNMDFIPTRQYDLFFGHVGHNFTHICNHLHSNCIKISFSPGDHWKFFNTQEEKRFEELRNRKGITLLFDRYRYDLETEEKSLLLSDGIVCLGDESVCKPFSDFTNVVHLNNASYPDNHYDNVDKGFNEGRNNFLFYSGGGNVHKGLDLLLEAFSKTDKHLYICTCLDSNFKDLYEKELSQSNIHFMGWVRQRSKKFYQIIDKCNFIIFPSCSEGSAGSVVECMNQGLIPIVSRETRIDVSRFGVFLNECTIQEIKDKIEYVSALPASELREKSLLTRKVALNEYSEEAFIRNMKACIQKITLASNNS